MRDLDYIHGSPLKISLHVSKSIFVKIGLRLSIALVSPASFSSYSTRNVISGCNCRSYNDARVNPRGEIIAHGGGESETRKRSFLYRPPAFHTRFVFSRLKFTMTHGRMISEFLRTSCNFYIRVDIRFTSVFIHVLYISRWTRYTMITQVSVLLVSQ